MSVTPPPYPQPQYSPQYPQRGYPVQGYAASPPPRFPPPPLPDFAPWGARVGSALVDGLIPAVIACVGLLSVLVGDLTVVLVVASVCYVSAFAFALWNSCYRQGRTGQSIGKKLVGTRLVRLRDGGTLGFWPTLGRQLAHVLDGLPFYLGYLWPLWDERRQTFADKVCDTVVVRVG